MRPLYLLSVAFVIGACAPPEPAGPIPLSAPRWITQTSGTSERLQAISPVNDDIIWASGTGGTFVRSLDGGHQWQAGVVAGGEDLEFRDVHALSADEAFLLSSGNGADSRIYRTRNGGENWTEVYRASDPGAFLDCFSMWDRSRGVAFSDAIDSDFLVLRTEDGGDSWNRVDPDGLEDARAGEGSFASSGTCLVSAPGGRAWFGTGASGVDTRVFRSTDYGASWSASRTTVPSHPGEPTSSSGIFTLAFLDETTGLALGGDYSRPDSTYGDASTTNDGGVTWNPTGDPLLGGSVFGSTFIPGAPTPTVIGVAPTGSSWSVNGGESWTLIDAENYWAVGASPAGRVWAVGPGWAYRRS